MFQKERKYLYLWIGIFNRIGAITFYVSGFIMDVIQTFLYILIMPFSKELFRKINKYFNAAMYSRKFIFKFIFIRQTDTKMNIIFRFFVHT